MAVRTNADFGLTRNPDVAAVGAPEPRKRVIPKEGVESSLPSLDDLPFSLSNLVIP